MGAWRCSSPATPRFFNGRNLLLRYTQTTMSGLDQDVVRHAMATARREGFRTVKLKSGDDRFSAVLDLDAWEVEEALDVVAPETLEQTPTEFSLTAPVVGYFRDPKETLKPGSKITSGSALCEIVALGLANDVTSKKDGEIVEVLVSPGDAVEYGQTLATVKPL